MFWKKKKKPHTRKQNKKKILKTNLKGKVFLIGLLSCKLFSARAFLVSCFNPAYAPDMAGVLLQKKKKAKPLITATAFENHLTNHTFYFSSLS